MIIFDTQRAAKMFAKFNVPLSGYIVNKVIPAELREMHIPDYLRNRLDMQSKYLDKIDKVFGKESSRACRSSSATSPGCP
jgi:arsenite-transporting ATPase